METVIVGYLVAYFAGAGRRFADKQIDGLLTSLANRVWQRLGATRAMQNLQSDYKNRQTQQAARAAIAQAASQDTWLREDLASLTRELDQRGARQLVKIESSSGIVTGINNGVIVHDGYVYIDNSSHRSDSSGVPDVSGDPTWVKVAFAVGALLEFAGIALFFYSLYPAFTAPAGTIQPEPDIGPPGLLALLGAGLLVLAMVGHSSSRPSGRR